MEDLNDIERRQLLCKLVGTMREKGSWCGETHIQKSVLFLQSFLGIPLGYRFVMYKHGPFSYDLRRELGQMLDGFIMDLKPNEGYGPSYLLGIRGDTYAHQSEQFKDEIQFVCNNVSIKGTRELERFSTAYFVGLEEKSQAADPYRIAQQICDIKPHIDFNDAIVAVRNVEKLIDKAENDQLKVKPWPSKSN